MHFTRASESPDAFHFWTGVGTIAGALRRRVWLDMRHFQWTPNFYIILVGPPGIAAKSTSVRIGTHLLEAVDGVKFGPQSMTWQSLTKSLEESIEYVKYYDIYGLEQLIDMWDGQLSTWGHRTKSSGNVEIKNPWLNVLACTTPSWLEEHFPSAMIGGGLTSRIMFIYGDKKRHLVPYPDAQTPEADYNAYRASLIEDLKRVATLSGGYLLSA